MREREIAYWEKMAHDSHEGGGIRDNWVKRGYLAKYLTRHSWIKEKVLEIGVGSGTTAAMLGFTCGRMWDYIGTDLSPYFAEQAGKFALKVVQADVLSLPEGPFTRIIALDSLEHVRPEDRDEGYQNIVKRLVPGGLLMINMPLDESLHKNEFDHGISLHDLIMLEFYGLKLSSYERFEIEYKGGDRSYAFVVMTK